MMGEFYGYYTDEISITEHETGYCRFKINYRNLEKIMDYSPFYSTEVVVGGIDFSLRYSKAFYSLTDASFDLAFGSLWDFKKTFELSLLDKQGNPIITASQGAYHYSIPLIVPNLILDSLALVNDGYFFLLCKYSGAVPEKPRQEMSLPVQLGKLLEGDEMTDLTLEVNGEAIYAHKAILGARSPYFKALLFGSMVESKLGYLRIEDTETEVFKYVLQYIYTDTIDKSPEIPSTNLAQKLLVAADRYGVEGLKMKCEEKLSKDVTLDSVLSSFALAEKYYCGKLKEACFKFATEPANLGNLMFTEEYLQFMKNYPALVAELRSRSGCSERRTQNFYAILKRQTG
ncbi:BTB/POZ and MATH domain-containing protein 2 [Rhynchospora pubera]|uniref:BTB/POZ and MATH domain-containing protein 2 n=1 Tax=Rhynchospora pubera TaxID=906938 RepID=A0AAV8DKX7_9POAL|nr:BTB/POZ and MATH domain-containing protein 2 [Rhynchospora pubera]